jgi:mRNA-degrading endonuclease RelE of RelBE toxin-antitoxin system
MRFKIDVAPAARSHIASLRKRDQQVILDAIERHLGHQPATPARNRKLLRENSVAPWELRVRAFRVFYDVLRDPDRVVILAVGHKVRNTLYIGDKEVEL